MRPVSTRYTGQNHPAQTLLRRFKHARRKRTRGKREIMLAIIPARGNSKGLPGKNIAPVAGHPLIAWTIDAARRSDLFERVVVTSDSSEILDVSSRYGAEPIRRPEALATDTASPKDAVLHVLETLGARGYRPETLALLQPTSPLRIVDDIVGAARLVSDGGFASAATYSPAVPHPARAFHVSEDGTATPVYSDREVWQRRQDHGTQYHLNGSVYVVGTEAFLANPEPSFLVRPIGAFIVPQDRAVDIDIAVDLKLAEIMLDGRDEPRLATASSDAAPV